MYFHYLLMDDTDRCHNLMGCVVVCDQAKYLNAATTSASLVQDDAILTTVAAPSTDITPLPATGAST